MLTVNNISSSNYYQRNNNPAFKMAVIKPAKAAQEPMRECLTKATNGELTSRVKKGLRKMIEKLNSNKNHLNFLEDGSVEVVNAETKETKRFIPSNTKTKRTKFDKFLDKCLEVMDPVYALPAHYKAAFDAANKMQAQQLKKANQIKDINKIFDRYGVKVD